MSKSFAILLLLIVLSFIGYLWYLEYNTYEMTAGPQNTVYKLNKRTGEVVWIVGEKEQAMIDQSKNTPEEKAIKLVSDSYADGYEGGRVGKNIQNSIKNKKGDLKVYGWRAQRVDENTFLIIYLWEHEGKHYFRSYEAIMNAQIVRNVNRDSTLKNKYTTNMRTEFDAVFGNWRGE